MLKNGQNFFEVFFYSKTEKNKFSQFVCALERNSEKNEKKACFNDSNGN